ncbi:MAG: ribonuclease P protein component [Deltaproteobacteria bacterium]|nr:ribonuclease P protein component [Deltaproteobacteria bacterium]
MEKENFRKDERIRKRGEFLIIYKRGVRRHSENFTVIVFKNRGENKRLGIAVSKKVGDAVKRNRIKRLVREFFRLNKHRFPSSQDIVIIGKKFLPTLTYKDVRVELESLLINKSDS